MSANRVLYNGQFGGFSLSPAACEKLNVTSRGRHIVRHDLKALAVVDELGVDASSGRRCDLRIKQLDGEWYTIEETDGAESVCDRVKVDVYSTAKGNEGTVYELNVSLQDLYYGGYISERTFKTQPQNVVITD